MKYFFATLNNNEQIDTLVTHRATGATCNIFQYKPHVAVTISRVLEICYE